jgi:hypothetical protein
MKERILQGHLHRSDSVAGYILDREKKKDAHRSPPQTVSHQHSHFELGLRSSHCNVIASFVGTT